MNPIISSPVNQAGRILTSSSVYAMCAFQAAAVLITGSLHGQNAGNPAAPTSPAPASSASPAKSKQADAKSNAPDLTAINTPSRYIAGDDIAAYITKVSALVSINKRTLDPFGRYQDPDAKPIIRTPVPTDTRPRAAPQILPFSEIVNRIKVNTLMPSEGKFLIGNRKFSEGERMNLTFRMKNIPVDIVSVKAGAIDFRNAETKETVTLKIHLLPAGMIPGSEELHPPGMIRENKNSPIDLDAETSGDS